MKNLKQFLKEYSKKKDFFPSYTAAIDYALKLIPANHTYDEQEYFNTVASGPRKPSEGNTVRWKLPLYKGDKHTRFLVVSVYNRGGNAEPFELTAYIS